MKQTFTVLKTVFSVAVTVLAVGMAVITVLSATLFNRSDRSVFGYQLYIVTSDSMSATHFRAGDLILVNTTFDPAALQAGDVITFHSQNRENFGETVTHRIRRRTVDAHGNSAFITYGTTTDTDDETMVTVPYILGKYEGRVPALGLVFDFLKTPTGYFFCIFLPFALLIAYEGWRCVGLWRRYRAEQTAQAAAETERLEAENRQMREELEALKAKRTAEAHEGGCENAADP